jgi:hypothetical protein
MTKASPSEQRKAVERAKRSGFGGILEKQWRRDANKTIAQALQSAAVKITNELVKIGPAWSGEFSASWDVVPDGATPREPRGKGRIYEYTVQNFPVSRYENALESKKYTFSLVNSSEHAEIALDEVESLFTHPDDFPSPIKETVRSGFRPQSADGQELSYRWQIGDVNPTVDETDPNAFITAEPDWFLNYLMAGGLSRDFDNGVSLVLG